MVFENFGDVHDPEISKTLFAFATSLTGARGTDDRVHAVLGHEGRRGAPGGLGLRVVVLMEHRDRLAEHAACGVDLLHGHDRALPILRPERGQAARDRKDRPDLQDAVLGRAKEASEHRGQEDHDDHDDDRDSNPQSLPLRGRLRSLRGGGLLLLHATNPEARQYLAGYYNLLSAAREDKAVRHEDGLNIPRR